MNFTRCASIVAAVAAVGGCGPSEPPAAEAPAATGPAAPGVAGTGLWGCTMCPEVQSRTSGKCPTCGMALVALHGAGAYVCLEHAEDGAMDLEPGKCRECGKPMEAALTRLVHACSTHDQVLGRTKGPCAVCGKEMLARRMAVMWECDEHGLVSLDGGRCPTCGKELLESLVALPHGDHSPKHGGLFFMAPDRWHHLEGVLLANDTFRLYLYDNFTRPMSSEGVTGYVQVGHVTDNGDVKLEEKRHALAPVGGTTYLEVASADFRPPLDLALSLSLPGGDEELDRFDFTFTALSRDPGPTAADEPPQVDIDIEVEIPSTSKEILLAIDERRREVRRHVEARRLDRIYRPALEAKELTLALEPYADEVPPERRSEVAGALYQAVRGAWLLDLHGDLGELAKVREAEAVFTMGLDRLQAAFSSPGR